MKIWFDMDGTIADLYGVENWLADLNAGNVRPYAQAKPMVNLAYLARLLHKAQQMGHEIGIISWLSKSGTIEYNNRVTQTKVQWLKQHLPSVHWDVVNIVPYGTPKHQVCKEGILFDNEARNRDAWSIGKAYEPDAIFNVLKALNG